MILLPRLTAGFSLDNDSEPVYAVFAGTLRGGPGA